MKNRKGELFLNSFWFFIMLLVISRILSLRY